MAKRKKSIKEHVYAVHVGCIHEGSSLKMLTDTLELALEVGDDVIQRGRWVSELFPEPWGPWVKERGVYTRRKPDTSDIVTVTKEGVRTCAERTTQQ